MAGATCAYCGATFTPPARGRPKRYCEERCRRAAQNARRGHAEPGTRRPRAPRKAGTRTRRPRRERPAGTKLWMVDPTVRACSAEGCFFDAATCPEHGRRKT